MKFSNISANNMRIINFDFQCNSNVDYALTRESNNRNNVNLNDDY